MFTLGLILTTGLSLYIWGVIRTAIWLIPGILALWVLPLAWLSILSFFALVAVFAPYQRGAFDTRRITREKWALIFFLCGAIAGSFPQPTDLIFFGIGSLYPILAIQLQRLLRHPPSQVLFFPKRVRWYPLALLGTIVLFDIFQRLRWFDINEVIGL